MEGVEFDFDNTQSKQSLAIKAERTRLQHSPFISLLGKIGVTDKTTASLILLGVAALLFGLAIFIYAGSVSKSAATAMRNPAQEAAQLRVLQSMQASQPAPQSGTQQ